MTSNKQNSAPEPFRVGDTVKSVRVVRAIGRSKWGLSKDKEYKVLAVDCDRIELPCFGVSLWFPADAFELAPATALEAEREKHRAEIEEWRSKLAEQCGQTLAAQIERDTARAALQEIADQDVTEIALDPDWPKRIASAALPLQPAGEVKKDDDAEEIIQPEREPIPEKVWLACDYDPNDWNGQPEFSGGVMVFSKDGPVRREDCTGGDLVEDWGAWVPEANLEEKEKQIATLEARNKKLEFACSKINQEVCQELGKALGYPWFKDDQKNFPDATEKDGVCVGEHVAESIAAEAAKRIATLEAKQAALPLSEHAASHAAEMERMRRKAFEQGAIAVWNKIQQNGFIMEDDLRALIDKTPAGEE